MLCLLKKILILLFINLIIFFLISEALTRIALYDMVKKSTPKIIIKDGSEYTYHLSVEKEFSIDPQAGKIPHPYFGYVTENQNFEKIENLYPFNKKTYNVGIFGGSVAGHVVSENKKHQLIEKAISETLQINPENIRVIKFSTGGYKQPQQHNIASLYGENLDLVLNIEGSNEMTYIFQEEFPHYYPLETASRLYFKSLNNIGQVPDFIKSVENRGQYAKKIIADLYFTRLEKTIDLLLYKYHDNSLTQRMNELNKNSKHPFFESPRNKPQSTKDLFYFWLKMSCLQQNNLNEQGPLSLFFVQPLPYLHKILTSEEQSILKNNTNINKLTGQFLQEVEFDQIRQSGLQIFSLLKVFENERKNIYIDYCCHMNDYGNDLLVRAIAKTVRNQLNQKKQTCHLNEIKKYINELSTE